MVDGSSERERAATGRAATPAGFATARMIAISMVMGVVMMWVVATVMPHEAGVDGTAQGLTPQAGFLIWGVLAVGTFAAMMLFRSRALALVDDARSKGGAAAVASRAGEIQTQLIICWALIEAPALFAGVLVLLLGTGSLLYYAAPIYLLGVALTFPRADWFGA